MPSRRQRTHYDVLEVTANASAEEIKRAYRRLVKQHHPDRQTSSALDAVASAERIRQVNAAYEILKHRQSRQDYDNRMSQHARDRATRAQSVADMPRQPTASDEELARQVWIQKVYTPLNRKLSSLLRSLAPQLKVLSADPYDEVLTDEFAAYVDRSRIEFARIERLFRQHPNPSTLAGVASRLYYCINQLGDALEELRYFPLNFDDRHLHTGQELFRIARGLRQEAAETLQASIQR
ncbi:J domain-containing protein [Synechococcus sp. PCC 7336]|uniref:J domain-containing protein n=1 Tax=Synechococcus sp. PCC 7336 TaxID=195250 RepID=UPI000348D929|nr:J domain-containing protein [Synechococcus sp. PCC 7336]